MNQLKSFLFHLFCSAHNLLGLWAEGVLLSPQLLIILWMWERSGVKFLNVSHLLSVLLFFINLSFHKPTSFFINFKCKNRRRNVFVGVDTQNFPNMANLHSNLIWLELLRFSLAVCGWADCAAAGWVAPKGLWSWFRHFLVHCYQHLWNDCVEGLQSHYCEHWKR